MPGEAELILEEGEKRFAQAEVFEQVGETRSVSFENNILKRATARQFRGVGLRVISEGRVGFASTTDLREPRRLVEMAGESARFGERARFEFPQQPELAEPVPTEDRSVGEVTFEKMAAIGREGLEMSLAANSDYLYSCSVSTKSGTTCILNSRGLRVEYAKTDMAASVGIQEVSDSGLLEVYEFKSWSQPFDSLCDIAEVALTKMRQAGAVVPAKAEVMPVIFTPKALENLLEPVMLALNAKLVHKGASRLAGRIGERVLDERITILDDASVPYALNSAPVDCEGVAARQFAVVEKGVLRSYLLDLQTAGLLGMKTTGSGHRSYAGQPAPSPSNTVIEPGSDSFEDMVSGLKRGLVADQTLGSGQSNTLAGEFSVNVSLGFLVEDGKIRGRVKNCMIAGNVYELLSKVEGISRERQWLGADYVPAFCVSGIRIAAQSSEKPDIGA